MSRRPSMVIGLLAAGLVRMAAATAAPAPTHAEGEEARIRRVEQGLLPPVLFEGEKGWSLEERMRFHKVPGLSMAVFENGTILWTKGYGVADAESGTPATATTLFQAASISKPVTCFAALSLAREGKLDLDAPVNAVLRSWKLPENDLTRQSPVTLRRIMSHNAGLTVHGFPGYEPGEPLPTVPQILDGQLPANTGAVRVDLTPGTRFRYSGGGTVVLGLAMTEATGEPFPALMQRLALAPLGMNHSGYLQPLPPEKAALAATGHGREGRPVRGRWHVYPELAAAGLWTTAEDLARFALGVQQSLAGRKGAPLPQELAWGMVTKVTDTTGLGFFVEEGPAKSLFRHSGGNAGFQCDLVAGKSAAHGVAIMTNSDNGGRLTPEIVRAVAREYGWTDLQPPSFRPALLSAEKLAAFEGRFRYGADQVAGLRVLDGTIRAELLGDDPLTLVPVSETELVAREEDVRLRFVSPDHVQIAVRGARTEAERLGPSDRLPSDLAFEGLLEAAVAEYTRLEAAGEAAGREDRLNALGYRLARRDARKAQAILRVNTLMHPDSANGHDSLAEISLQAGDEATAAESYRKVLEVLDRDPKASPELKARLRTNAEARLEELRKGR